MKIVITEDQVIRLTESLQEQLDIKPIPRPQSDFLGKGGGFERKLYAGDKESYIENLKKQPANHIKKVSLIFPQKKWEEIALYLLNKLGIVTGFYKSLAEANKFISWLTSKNVKTDELIIGSHGMEGTLLATQTAGESFYFDNSFLDNIKNIVHSGTKVFFTACHGADFLDSLKDAAEKLGTGVYGSAGIYNYINNQSEKGFYYCSSKSFTPPTTKEIKALDYPEGRNNFDVFLKTSDTSDDRIKYRITIKDSVFGVKIPELYNETFKPDTSNKIIVTPSPVRSLEMYARYTIFPVYEITDYLEANNIQLYDRIVKNLKKKNIEFVDYVRQNVLNGNIIISVFARGIHDVTKLPSIKVPEDITNEYLLSNGLCTKVNGSPISWIDKIAK